MSDRHFSEYDQRVLDITRELCLQLNISGYNPTFVSWETFDSRIRGEVDFRYDDCLIEPYCVTLSSKMKDLLAPDELRPIIASSLIFSKVLRRSQLRQTVVVFAVLLGLSVFLSFELGPSVIIAGLSAIVIGTFVTSVFYSRRLRSLADRKAADIVTPTAFLTTLNKISEMIRETGADANLRYTTWTALNTRGAGAPIPVLPDIQKRIARLQSYSQAK